MSHANGRLIGAISISFVRPHAIGLLGQLVPGCTSFNLNVFN